MVKAAELLAGEYRLVITNVPYLGRGKQNDTLKKHLEQHYPHSKADLATAFVERCLEFCAKDGTTALVTPQNWLFLTGYTKLRERLLKCRTWRATARLGPNAFQDMNWWAAPKALLVLSHGEPSFDHTMMGNYSRSGNIRSSTLAFPHGSTRQSRDHRGQVVVTCVLFHWKMSRCGRNLVVGFAVEKCGGDRV